MKKLVLIYLSLTLLSACSKSFDGGYNMPLLYKIDIQQGNVIEQDMINKLRPGMDKNQVKFIMGTPVIVDPFHNNRWEYIFSMQKGGSVREQRHITLHFDEDEKLTHVSGDIEVSETARVENDIVTEDEAVVVPEGSYEGEEKGFFGKLWEKVTPGDD
jgi:outer membrane protein assembly factor BamE